MKPNATASDSVWERARLDMAGRFEDGTAEILDASGCVLVVAPLSGEPAAAAQAGEATHVRFVSVSGKMEFRGRVGKPGSGAPLELNRLELRVGDPVTVESFNLGWAD